MSVINVADNDNFIVIFSLYWLVRYPKKRTYFYSYILILRRGLVLYCDQIIWKYFNNNKNKYVRVNMNRNSTSCNLLLQSALQPFCRIWPAQLSLSILSRKVFTECRCQQHVNPQLGGPVIRTFQLSPQGVPSVWNDASEPQQRKVELWARNSQ